MSNFTVPFARDAEKRLPVTDEKENGFPCGPASQTLFNGTLNQIQRELDAVHQAGGVVGADTDFNTTYLNIQALIDSAVGGADVSQYILISQARTRLPIYPEFLTSDGKINVSSPATGIVRLPGGIDFLHRGIFPIQTVETDFATDFSKIYHLRWNSTTGYVFEDLTSIIYNPLTLAEDDETFDSTYDDMLISRVITNASNVATITNLVNKDRIWENDRTAYVGTIPAQGGDGTIAFDISIDLGLSRVPKFRSALPHVGATATNSTRGLDGNANGLIYTVMNRYGVTVNVSSDFESTGTSGFYASVEWSFGA